MKIIQKVSHKAQDGLVLRSWGWHWILLILLSQPPMCWGYSYEAPLLHRWNISTSTVCTKKENKCLPPVTDLIWTLCPCYMTSIPEVRLCQSWEFCGCHPHSARSRVPQWSRLSCYIVCTGHNLASSLALSPLNSLHYFLVSPMENTSRERKKKSK